MNKGSSRFSPFLTLFRERLFGCVLQFHEAVETRTIIGSEVGEGSMRMLLNKTGDYVAGSDELGDGLHSQVLGRDFARP